MNRREFHRLAAATMGGLIAGASVALAQEDKKKDLDKPLLLQEPHVCRGLNTCKAKDKGKSNDCAGMGQCATARKHTCKGMNDCAGLGGCGAKPGENKCKGMGECAVPLKREIWAKARKSFEAAMKEADKQFGPAPKADG